MRNLFPLFKKLCLYVSVPALALGLVLPATQASAAVICDEPRTIYEISDPKPSRILSNLRGDWAEEGFTASYQGTTTAQVSASMSSTLEGDASIIVAEASASLGLTLGVSWSKAGAWSYGKTVPPGKEGRIVMYREGRAITVTLKRLHAPCRYETVFSETVNVPLMVNGSNFWVMQLHDRPAPGEVIMVPASQDSGDQGPGYEEIPVATEPD